MRILTSGLTLTFLVFIAGTSSAQQPPSIRACYGKTSGQLRVISSNETCKSSETEMTFTGGGAKGEKGDPGPAGPAGPPGPPGDGGSVTLVSLCDAVYPGVTDARTKMIMCTQTFGASKFVFLSRQFWGGLAELNSGIGNGLAGADAKCQRDASEAGLPGVYKAWLSAQDMHAADRLTHSLVPYMRPDFTVVANNWIEFASDTHRAGITLDAAGNVAASSFGLPVMAWTATTPTGASNVEFDPAQRSCNNWTTNGNGFNGNFGHPAATDASWTEAGVFRCDVPIMRLICVGQ